MGNMRVVPQFNNPGPCGAGHGVSNMAGTIEDVWEKFKGKGLDRGRGWEAEREGLALLESSSNDRC
jgi:hypothetical protein